MAGPGVLGELDILTGATQPLDIVPARLDGDKIIRSAVKNADRPIIHEFVFEVDRVARRVEGDVSSKLDARSAIYSLEALKTGIQRHEASFGEAHYGDARGI